MEAYRNKFIATGKFAPLKHFMVRARDGICTHEVAQLEDGLVIGTVIECPLHQGRFDVTNGKALSAPVCVDLKTYPTKVEDGDVYIDVPA